MHYLEEELYALIRKDPSIFDFLQKGSLDGVWYWDLENPAHEWMSDEFWRVLGIDPATRSHLAAEWQDLINPEDLETAIKNVKAHLADADAPYDQVVRYTNPDSGKVVTVRCRGIAIRDETGKPIRMLGAHTDLTELSEKTTELERVIASRDQFFRNMSHELRTPMNGIIGLTQLLRREETDDRRMRMFDALERSANSLLLMLDGLLDYARIDADQFDYNAVTLDPRDVVGACLRLSRSENMGDGAEFKLDFSKAPARAHISEAALRHVTQNLISNALKFGHGTPIEVVLRRDDAGGVILSVADNGPGISPSDLPHIFDDLFQGKEGKAKGGTGIGLSLSRRLCEGHGGSLKAENRAPSGAYFEAHLPEMASTLMNADQDPQSLRLLVADDVEINLMVVGEMLEAEGAVCTLARDGGEALEHLRTGAFDGALLDISMPVMSGTDVIAAYRNNPGLGDADLPIASHSAHMQPDQLVRYRKAGFGFHLPKPVTLSDVHRMKDWIAVELAR